MNAHPVFPGLLLVVSGMIPGLFRVNPGLLLVVSGMIPGLFRVYPGLLLVDSGLISGLFQVYSGFSRWFFVSGSGEFPTTQRSAGLIQGW